MPENVKAILGEGLDSKEASVKRAITSAKNPKFRVLYEQELDDIRSARSWLASQK